MAMDYSHEKGLIWGLLECSSDHNEGVRLNISCAIVVIGTKHPAMVLSAIHKFIANPQTTPKAHVQSLLYNAAENIVKGIEESIEKSVVEEWLSSCKLLLLTPSAAIDLQLAASSFIVALGSSSSNANMVFECLLSLLNPDVLPAQSVVDTLASLSLSNPRASAPFFNALLVKLLPYLPHIKLDCIKTSVSIMFAHFSEGFMDAISNKDNDSALSIESHNDICGEVYDILANLWLKTAGVLVKNDIIFALGHMSCLLSQEKLESHCMNIIIQINGHYKRNPSPYTLSLSLTLLCDALFKISSGDSIKLQVENTLSTLFNQVCSLPNYNEPLTVKNHCEVLRCYELLAKNFDEISFAYLILRLENASHVQRVGALILLKHLINSKSLSEEHIRQVITLLGSLLADPNSKVIKSLTQVIVALAHNGHLDQSSGIYFINYLVQHSSSTYLMPQSRSASLTDHGMETVGDNCSRALSLLSTTIPCAIPIVWPYLLHFVPLLEYEDRLSTILSCLGHLSSTKIPSNDKSIFDSFGVPSAHELLIRLLVLISKPGQPLVAIPALTLLRGLSQYISSNLDSLYTEETERLKSNVAGITSRADVDQLLDWHNSLRDFFEKTLLSIKSDSFITALIPVQMSQLQQSHKNHQNRCFIMALIGISLRHSNNNSLISVTLDSLNSSLNHKAIHEQESLALCVGLCGSRHFDLVMTQLESWLKSSDAKRSISFMSLLKHVDSRAEESSAIRCSIILCIGQIAQLTPANIIGSKIDGPIMLHLLNIVNSNKSDMLNEVIIQTISKICKSLLKLDGFQLRQRPLLMTYIVNCIKDNISLYPLCSALEALRDLAALEPKLDIEERTTMLQVSFAAFLNKFQNLESMDSQHTKCYSRLNVLIRTLIQRDPHPAMLDDVVTLLHSWTLSLNDIVRINALDLIYSSFCVFIENLNFTYEGPTSFNQTCQLLLIIIPRCGDPSKEVKLKAISCLSLVFKITAKYNGQSTDILDEDLMALRSLEESTTSADEFDMKQHCVIISKVLCSKLIFVQLNLFINTIICTLQDKQNESASQVASIISLIFSIRGHQFHQHGRELLNAIFTRLEKVTHLETRQHTVEAICNLSKHNLTLVLDILLDYPVPYEKGVCESLQQIGQHADLVASALVYLKNTVEQRHPYATHKTTISSEEVKIADIRTLAAICAMREIFVKLTARDPLDMFNSLKEKKERIYSKDSKDAQIVVHEHVASLCALLLLSYGSFIGVDAPLHQSSSDVDETAFVPNREAANLMPSKCVLECLEALVGVSDCPLLGNSIAAVLQNYSPESLEDFLQTISTITKLLVQELPQSMSSFVAYLDTHHSYEMQRVTVTAIFGELISEKCCGDLELMEIIVTGLLSRLNDQSVNVRKLSIRGLSHFSHLPGIQIGEKLPDIVEALVSATDLQDTSEESKVILEALRGLALLFPHLEPKAIIIHAATLLIRIRMYVEKPNGAIREASIGLLKCLAITIGEYDDFREQIHLHFIMTLIHLEDSYAPMAEICKSALCFIGPHLNCHKVNLSLQNHLNQNKAFVFEDLIQDITKAMTETMIEQLEHIILISIPYLRHIESSIRKAALRLTGCLISHVDPPLDTPLLNKVSHGIRSLLNDNEASVRMEAAIVVSMLGNYEKLL